MRENAGISADRFLLTQFLAFSPLTAREVAFRALGASDAPVDASNAERLWTAFDALCRKIEAGAFTPSLLTGPDGAMVEFSYTPITQYGAGLYVYPLRELFGAAKRLFCRKIG